MIDTNQINQAVDAARDIHAQVATNWPAICAGAVWIRAELKNVSAWTRSVADWTIGHGGIGWLLIKLLWNPPTKP